MDELFRFSMSRPPSFTKADTLYLSRRTYFQQNLEAFATANPHEWIGLQNIAIDFIENNYDDIIGLLSRNEILTTKKFGEELFKTDPEDWKEFVDRDSNKFTDHPAVFNSTIDALCDLFIAFVLIRCEGQTWLKERIKVKNIPITVAVLLQSEQPSLMELAELIRLIHLGIADENQRDSVEAINLILNKTLSLPVNIFRAPNKPIHPVGVADLLVVKQHIYRYEPGEIARIENILAGETRKHIQKHGLSNERETFLQTEKEEQTDQELTSTDHVSLKNEIENTLKEETKVNAGTQFKVSGSGYEFGANLGVSYDKASSQSSKTATEIAKDVTQKTAKRITQKVQQSERTKITETFEELEEQGFTNTDKRNHISGIYQWIDKVYLAQVFNYGKRLQFDLMVPEPAALLRKAASLETNEMKSLKAPDLVTFPITGSNILLSPLNLEESPNAAGYYGDYIAKFNVSGVEPPPSEFKIIEKPFGKSPVPDGDITISEFIAIDEGYEAISYNLQVTYEVHGGGVANSELVVLVGNKASRINEAFATPQGGLNRSYELLGGQLFDAPFEGSVGLGIKTNWVVGFTGVLSIKCQATNRKEAAWKLGVYEKIMKRWTDLQIEYNSKLESLKTLRKEASPILGSETSEINRQIERTEIKRSCISLLDNKDVIGFSDVADTPLNPPLKDINFVSTSRHGSLVRFFEHAFEWDKIGYVFYPYFWATSESNHWTELLFLKNDDLLFENFLKAGYARVVIPVRKGFEDAINFYLQTGKPWFGGALPKIGDRNYLSITEEIKEQTGAPGDEKPVGEPWEFRIPTRLIKLRKDDELPEWKLNPNPKLPKSTDSWSWIPKT